MASTSQRISNIELAIKEWASGLSNINVAQDDLNHLADSVLTVPQRNSAISNFTPSGSNGLILKANENRKDFFIQNLTISPLYVKYGTNASNSSFNYVLSGTNFTYFKDAFYTGDVSVSGSSTPNYISWERV